MTVARSRLIDLSATPYYHLVNRCVRRAFICGEDKRTGINYDHRREWIVDKIKQLSQVFCVDVHAYAVMSNHYHIVLHVNQAEAKQLTERQVAQRWTELFNGHLLVQRYLAGDVLSGGEAAQTSLIIEEYRQRLYSISWFMKLLNQSIALQANEEDNCTGCFWEGRYKSQALLDEQALLTCMAYVDLNPIRAGMAKTPEQSDYTSIQARIKHNTIPTALTAFKDQTDIATSDKVTSKHLYEQTPETHAAIIDFEYNDYLTLVDWSGRAILQHKKGHIPEDAPPILQRLGLAQDDWLNAVQYHEKRFPRVAGQINSIIKYAKRLQSRLPKGMRHAALFQLPDT